MIADVVPNLQKIIQTLRDGNLENAKERTVALIESAFQMSGPMYREMDTVGGASLRMPPTYTRAAERLRILTKDLRDVSFTMRRGTQADALVMAERALAVFLRPETLIRHIG